MARRGHPTAKQQRSGADNRLTAIRYRAIMANTTIHTDRPSHPKRRLLWGVVSLLLALLMGCTRPPECCDPPPGSLDPDVPPISGGSWARLGVATSWQWQLQGAIDDSYDVDLYDIDLFDVSAATIASLQADGRLVICYSAGSFEEWRPDANDFDEADLGKTEQGGGLQTAVRAAG